MFRRSFGSIRKSISLGNKSKCYSQGAVREYSFRSRCKVISLIVVALNRKRKENTGIRVGDRCLHIEKKNSRLRNYLEEEEDEEEEDDEEAEENG